jgi:hypothetical protein
VQTTERPPLRSTHCTLKIGTMYSLLGRFGLYHQPHFILDLFLLRWIWDDEDGAPWWAILLILIVILVIVGFVGASAGLW